MSEYQGTYELDFERPLSALARQIKDLEGGQLAAPRHGDATQAVDLSSEIGQLKGAHADLLAKTYEKLSPVNTVKVARHPGRPQSVDYIKAIVKDFVELHGDRHFGDDKAIICGFGRIGIRKVMVIGQHKGKDTPDRIAANFGCAHPEGYRKALRCMKLAEKFHLPVVTFIDTPGAYPGIGAEERGQAEAIAVNLREMARLKTPIVSVVIGEGGSGGALGIGVADVLAMMEYAWYSVISPEGCAAILWKTATPENNAEAARALKLTAKDNMGLGTVDAVVPEPVGGAHRSPSKAAELLEAWIGKTLDALKKEKIEKLLDNRYERLRKIGEVAE